MSSLYSKFPSALKELRIHFCQSSKESATLREFMVKKYLDIKKANPNLPILIREAQGVPPRAFARFDFGVEKKVALTNLNEKELTTKLMDLVKPPHA